MDRTLAWTIAGVAAAVVFGLVAFSGFTLKEDVLKSGRTTSPAGGSPSPTGLSTTTAPEPSRSTRSAATNTPPSRSDGTGGLAKIVVDVDVDGSIAVGERVGPNLWQLSEFGGESLVELSVAWDGRDSDGITIEGEECQMLIQTSGPEDIPSFRSGQCTDGHHGALNAASNYIAISKPGKYTVTVVDQVSKTKGSTTFKVVR
ncbi:hypothetical protein [Phycicoccus flavus]|uniref:hypothetical protein n=1 Tax=Phycicoccus flavus TaxID=2502783 RepID=UPI000FF67C1B|nr:hypothetical protein [Phycicoccus flavus]NHA70280.1 hypothetical protein [Phycicoccus flavus]